eukprot:COSAG06_NODE_74_length_25881_cov_16.549569_2_plen_140_part_00
MSGAVGTLGLLTAALAIGAMSALHGAERRTVRRFLEDDGGDDGDDDALSGCTIEKVGCFTVRSHPLLPLPCDRAYHLCGRLTCAARLHRMDATGRSAAACSTAWRAARGPGPPPRRPRAQRATSRASRTSSAASTATSG